MTVLTISSGLARLEAQEYQSVHADCIARIHQDISDPLPYFLLGEIASKHGNHKKALELFTKSADLAPSEIWYCTYEARELSTLGRSNAAKESADKAAALTSNNPFICDTLGVIYSRSGYHELAIPLFEKATHAKPDEPNYHYNLGASAQFLGDFDKARAAYETTIALNPKFYRAWSSLISLKKQTAEANHLERLEDLFENANDDADARLQLGHAIAKTLEDLGQYEESFDWLVRAKAMKRDQFRYDRNAGRAVFEAAKQTIGTPQSTAINRDAHTPIFIIGLPRTGTTLVDRILSSHSEVTSAGELNIFAELIKMAADTPSNLVLDPETLQRSQDINLRQIGQKYLRQTADKAQGAAYMVDKMPLNFFYAALIHRALPNARIIALRRGAMDSCLSNFRQLFSTQYSFYNYTFDLQDTAEFYKGFDDLIGHWRAHLPKDRFMEIHYEDIVFDQENQTRRLLEFCGLPWEEACLRFHENKASVSTASSVQVRQPLYSGSVDRWKKYGDRLDGLREVMGNRNSES